MPDPFDNHTTGVESPAIGAFAIEPSDSADLPQAIRAVTVGGAGGAISFVSSRTGLVSTTASLPPGTYPLFAARILAAGTTATGLTGWV